MVFGLKATLSGGKTPKGNNKTYKEVSPSGTFMAHQHSTFGTPTYWDNTETDK